MESKKPDSIVWNSETGYDAKSKSYPTNISAPAFQMLHFLEHSLLKK
jgi:hypothetical protein